MRGVLPSQKRWRDKVSQCMLLIFNGGKVATYFVLRFFKTFFFPSKEDSGLSFTLVCHANLGQELANLGMGVLLP